MSGFMPQTAFIKKTKRKIHVCNCLNPGVALDGFPIYGPYDEFSRLLSSSDLDKCHGRVDRHRNYRFVEF